MEKRCRVLLVEDSEEDALLIVRELRRAGYDVQYELVASAEATTEALKTNRWDLVIADYTMPNFSGPAALNIVQEQKLDLPFIIVSGTIGEETAVQSMKEGAHDYIMKTNLNRLAPAVEREIRERKIRSERRAAKEELRASEARFRQIFDNSSHGMWLVGRDLNLLAVNEAFTKLSGVSRRDAVGRPCYEVFPCQRCKTPECTIEEISSGRDHVEYEEKRIRADGSTVPCIVCADKITSSTGETAAIVHVFTDISIQKKAEEELLRSNAQLRELDHLKSQFLATASHELRTPLTIIREYIGLMKDGITGPVNDDQAECLDSALRNCDRLGDLINDVLDLQKIESGRHRIKRRETNLAGLLKQCYNDFLPKYKSKGQELKLRVQEGLPSVLCDEGKIHQVLVNLVGNAHKFVPHSGMITIEAYCKEDSVVVEVDDNGPGISEENQAKIFDKFTQLDTEQGFASKGTGLGLAIVASIIELHHSTINLDSAPGRGSKFSFSLPIYREQLELRSRLEDRMVVTLTQGRELWLLLLQLGSSESTVDPEEIEQITKITSDSLRYDDDEVFFLRSDNLLAILAEAGDKGAQAIVHRAVGLIARELGAGLSLSRSIVRVDSGSEAEELIATATDQLTEVGLSGSGKRVLVVDDEENITTAVTRLLNHCMPSLAVETANDGYDACIQFGQFEPDLVILDICMTGCDGLEVLRRIKQSEIDNKTRVLVLSGVREKFGKMLDLGADDCVAKPFDDNLLLEKISELLYEGKMREVASRV